MCIYVYVIVIDCGYGYGLEFEVGFFDFWCVDYIYVEFGWECVVIFV